MSITEMKEMAEKIASSVRSKHARLRHMRIKKALWDWERRTKWFKTNDWPATDRPMDDDIYD